VPYDDVDFERRGHVAESGWPIEHQDIAVYYAIATRQLDCGKPVFQAPGEAGGGPSEEVRLDSLERWCCQINSRLVHSQDREPLLPAVIGKTISAIPPRRVNRVTFSSRLNRDWRQVALLLPSAARAAAVHGAAEPLLSCAGRMTWALARAGLAECMAASSFRMSAPRLACVDSFYWDYVLLPDERLPATKGERDRIRRLVARDLVKQQWLHKVANRLPLLEGWARRRLREQHLPRQILASSCGADRTE
jgi:hypothetical protein